MRMSIFPIKPLVGRVKMLILATFDVPEQQAQEHAAETCGIITMPPRLGLQASGSLSDDRLTEPGGFRQRRDLRLCSMSCAVLAPCLSRNVGR